MEFRLLKADEIECRVSTVRNNGVSLLLYKDARVDQNILDETVGPENWQRKHKIIGGNLFCNVGIYIKEHDQWVWKQDVGTESYTEKEKGQASDAFKRACFNWGIGRELYTAPSVWVPAEDVSLKEKEGKWTTYDRFAVREIGYIGRKISTLVIANKTKNKVVFSLKDDFIGPEKIATLKADLLSGYITDEAALFKYFGVKDYSEFTETMFRDYVEAKEKHDREKRSNNKVSA